MNIFIRMCVTMTLSLCQGFMLNFKCDDISRALITPESGQKIL